MKNNIRMETKSDIPQLNTIALFPQEMLDDTIADYLNKPNTEEIWFTATENNNPITIGYCDPEKLTNGTYNRYAIGVRKDIQAKGIGSKMMSFVEDYLKNKGHRIFIADTSETDDFKMTRRFYEKLNYTKEAVIRNFCDEGDDKVIFWKQLRS